MQFQTIWVVTVLDLIAYFYEYQYTIVPITYQLQHTNLHLKIILHLICLDRLYRGSK